MSINLISVFINSFGMLQKKKKRTLRHHLELRVVLKTIVKEWQSYT